jgi:hypothetical protein
MWYCSVTLLPQTCANVQNRNNPNGDQLAPGGLRRQPINAIVFSEIDGVPKRSSLSHFPDALRDREFGSAAFHSVFHSAPSRLRSPRAALPHLWNPLEMSSLRNCYSKVTTMTVRPWLDRSRPAQQAYRQKK